MSLRREINEYLALEWGLEGREVADDAPFNLSHVADLVIGTRAVALFTFEADGDRYFATGGTHFSFSAAGEMSAEDYHFQEVGAAAIAQRDPVDLNTSRLGDPSVPPAVERRQAIHEMVQAAGLKPTEVTVKEGLFLVADGGAAALVETADGSRLAIVDGETAPVDPVMHGLSSWRQLAHTVGRGPSHR